MPLDDTIVAISSAASPAARIILRLSGSQTRDIIAAARAPALPPGSANWTSISIDALVIPAWLYWFEHPRSYTGDDLAELHLPGNPLLARIVLDWAVRQGARLAEPGEFTSRAYLNGRIDLAQAEGVAAIIGARNAHQLRAARQLMAGELSSRLAPHIETAAQILARVEAEIDFSDQDVTALQTNAIKRQLDDLRAGLENLLRGSERFDRITGQPTVVLGGRPNAGKSTLLNALAGYTRALMSPAAGTTRDVLSAEVRLASGVINLVDIAGIEEPSDTASGEIAEQMRSHALTAIRTADVLVNVREMNDSQPFPAFGREPDLFVETKMDLHASAQNPIPCHDRSLRVSAQTGAGMDELRAILDRIAFGHSSSTASLALTSRHLAAIQSACDALARAADHVHAARFELLAAELRLALDDLGQVRGVVTPDDVLGKIFAQFCIGK